MPGNGRKKKKTQRKKRSMEEKEPVDVSPSKSSDRSLERNNRSLERKPPPEPPRVPPIMPPPIVHGQVPIPPPGDYPDLAPSKSVSNLEMYATSVETTITSAMKKKKEEKHRKRDPRAWENLHRVTIGLDVEAGYKFMEEFYNQMYNENRENTVNLHAKEKQLAKVVKELEKDRNDMAKSILAKAQLENLCRELQKQNKLIKEENMARIKEEEEKRKEVANSFTERLNSLTCLISESKDKSNQVKEENQTIAQKFTQLYEQYQERESHLDTMAKQLDLQKKWTETQIKKAELENEAERQILLVEKKSLAIALENMQKEMLTVKERNEVLSVQVDLYKEQYTVFENTMTKSNDMFETFKKEIGAMSKKLRQMELERDQFKNKYLTSVNNLVSLSEKHLAVEKEKSKLENQLISIKKLCRKLQEDRHALIRQVKSINLEPDLKLIPQDVTSDDEPKKDSDEPLLDNAGNSDANTDKIPNSEGSKQNGDNAKDVATRTATAAIEKH